MDNYNRPNEGLYKVNKSVAAQFDTETASVFWLLTEFCRPWSGFEIRRKDAEGYLYTLIKLADLVKWMPFIRESKIEKAISQLAKAKLIDAQEGWEAPKEWFISIYDWERA